MSGINQLIRKEFNQSLICFVRITPSRFIISYRGMYLPDDETQELCGEITRLHLVRKRFEDNCPVCQSRDGKTSMDGTLCETCDDPDCRPGLRLYLNSGNRRCIVDLNATSAQNLCAFNDQLEKEGGCLEGQAIRMSLKNHHYWAEVCFEKFDRMTEANDDGL